MLSQEAQGANLQFQTIPKLNPTPPSPNDDIRMVMIFTFPELTEESLVERVTHTVDSETVGITRTWTVGTG